MVDTAKKLLVEVRPESELLFNLKTPSSVKVSIKNVSAETIGYIIKTTNPKTYLVKPNKGFILVGETVELEIKTASETTKLGADKFLIDAFVVAEKTQESDLQTLAKSTPADQHQSIKLQAKELSSED